MSNLETFLLHPSNGVIYCVSINCSYFAATRQYVDGVSRQSQGHSYCTLGDPSGHSNNLKNQRLKSMTLTIKFNHDHTTNQSKFFDLIQEYKKSYPNDHVDIKEVGQVTHKSDGVQSDYVDQAQVRMDNRKHFDLNVKSYYDQLTQLENQLTKIGVKFKSNCNLQCDCNCDLIANRYQIDYPPDCQIPDHWLKLTEDWSQYRIEIRCHEHTRLYQWLHKV